MSKRLAQGGFTTLELVFITVIIGVLLTLLITTRAGIQQNQRNTERQHDVKELRDGLEGYYAANTHYPTLAELNDDSWRSTHLKALEADAYRDPSGSDAKLSAKPAAGHYSYSVTSASGTPCDSAKNPCTQYTLTATLEGGGIYSKNNLN